MTELKLGNFKPEKKVNTKVADSIEEGAVQVPVRILTEDQTNVLAELLAFSDHDTRCMHVLEGWAGTGKTFITQELLTELISNYATAVTATTNKAVKVIYKALGKLATDGGIVAVCTIHSLLGLKERIGQNGEITFEPDRSIPRKIDDVDYVLIDESSMLPDELFMECVLYSKRGVKFLFVGDGYQIPPVGKVSSIPFNKEDSEIYSITRSVLTKIVRQAAGNPIIALSVLIRERPNYRGVLADLYPEATLTGGEGIAYLQRNEVATFDTLLEKLYTSPKFKEDADYVKTIAWRNVTVNKLNAKIRAYYLPDAKEVFVEGDKLVANTPIIEDIEGRVITIYSTNEEFEVSEVRKGVVSMEEQSFDTYVLKTFQVNFIAGSRVVTYKTIEVIHEGSEALLEKVLKAIKNLAMDLKDNPKMRAETWTRYYALARRFADVKYNYCLTIHKSQGSTYENCIVMEDDLNCNPNILERSKIKYTAVTRASKRLIVVY